MPKKPWTGKALAERRWRAFQLYLAGFTQEEIADKVGMHRSVVSRGLQSVRESACPGESPDVQEACFIQMERMKFKGASVAVRPDTHAVGRNIQPRGGDAILERKDGPRA